MTSSCLEAYQKRAQHLQRSAACIPTRGRIAIRRCAVLSVDGDSSCNDATFSRWPGWRPQAAAGWPADAMQSFLAPAGSAGRRQDRIHAADRAGHGRTGAQSHYQHHRVQRHFAGAAAADEGGRAGHGERGQRHRRAGVRAFSRTADSLRCGRLGGRRHARGASARKPQLSVHAHARRHALVSHPHHVDGRSAPRQLHRHVRLSDRRGREQSRQLRSGTLPGAARLGAVFHQPADG